MINILHLVWLLPLVAGGSIFIYSTGVKALVISPLQDLLNSRRRLCEAQETLIKEQRKQIAILKQLSWFVEEGEKKKEE